MVTDIIELRDPAAYEIAESNPLRKIELVGRTCYNSVARITDISAEPFVRNLMERGHETPLESARVNIHHDVFAKEFTPGISRLSDLVDYMELENGIGLQNMDLVMSDRLKFNRGKWDKWDITANVRDLLKLMTIAAESNREYAIDALINILKHPETTQVDDYATVRIETDRGIGNELVRHRVLAYEDDVISAYTATADDMSMVQASTRYIKWREVPVPIMRPLPIPWEDYGDEYGIWLESCRQSAKAYRELIALGQAPQYARNVLPLSTATTIVMTGTADQWRSFLKLRLDYAAHPQMRYIAGLLRKLPSIVRLIPLGTLKTDEEN